MPLILRKCRRELYNGKHLLVIEKCDKLEEERGMTSKKWIINHLRTIEMGKLGEKSREHPRLCELMAEMK